MTPYLRRSIFFVPALAAAVLLVLANSGFKANAATVTAAPAPLTYGAWIPFWSATSGVPEATAHVKDFSDLSPFSFEVDPEAGVVDKMSFGQEPWKSLVAAARANGVKIIPTIAWFNRDAIYAKLSNPTARANHIEDIWGTMLIYNLDGIDIDYENKSVETRPYFSAFIKELSERLHDNSKILYCTIETRTPVDSRFTVDSSPYEYVNDYAVLNKYCDEVRLMAYDQGNVDKKLDISKGIGQPYLPVADPDWVRKVIGEALKSISPKKLVLGIPTYGYEFRPADNLVSLFPWTRTRSVNFKTIMEQAASLGIKPQRNSAGELSFAYMKDAGSVVLASASQNPMSQLRIPWFSDAVSVQGKIDIARQYGLKGVVLFKIDGEMDPAIWNILDAKK